MIINQNPTRNHFLGIKSNKILFQVIIFENHDYWPKSTGRSFSWNKIDQNSFPGHYYWKSRLLTKIHREVIFLEQNRPKFFSRSLLLKIMIIDQNPPGGHFLGTKSTKILLQVIIIGNRKKRVSAQNKKSHRKEKKNKSPELPALRKKEKKESSDRRR